MTGRDHNAPSQLFCFHSEGKHRCGHNQITQKNGYFITGYHLGNGPGKSIGHETGVVGYRHAFRWRGMFNEMITPGLGDDPDIFKSKFVRNNGPPAIRTKLNRCHLSGIEKVYANNEDKYKKYAGTKMYRHIGKTGCGSEFI